MLKMHAMLDSCSLSRMAGEGWGEGAFKARGAKAPLIRPSGTFSRLREKGEQPCSRRALGAVS